jgi:organic radical activating enzyme
MSFNNFKLVLDFLKNSKEKTVRLMGGEPTIHSQFKEIIGYTFSQGFSLKIYTNGIFPSNLAKFLAKYKNQIRYSFNVNSPNSYSMKTWNQVNKNLGILSPFRNILVGNVIYQKDFNIDYLIDLAKKYSLRGILLRTANPIINQNNKYISLKDYSVLVKNLIKGIKQANQNKIGVGFGCGLAKKSFSKMEQRLIKDYQVVTRGWGCNGNSGRFDIGVDLSVFRCFPLSYWRKKKLSDFSNTKEAERYFIKTMEKYESGNISLDSVNQGPCFAYLLKSRK